MKKYNLKEEEYKISDKIKGAFWGLLIGDALGVPYEFTQKKDMPNKNLIDMIPPSGFNRTYPKIQSGTWSDDGAQAICLMRSLTEKDGLNQKNFSEKLVNWAFNGYMAVDSNVFDIGSSTHAVLQKIKNGGDPVKSGNSGEFSNGNGSLMRCLPILIWSIYNYFENDFEEVLILYGALQSEITHAHILSKVCCSFYLIWAAGILLEEKDAWKSAANKLRSYYISQEDHASLEVVDYVIKPDEYIKGNGTGYVLDSLYSARMILDTETNFKDCAIAAVALGNDTDTTACITCGLAGLKYGFDNIPKKWYEMLRGKELIQDLIDYPIL